MPRDESTFQPRPATRERNKNTPRRPGRAPTRGITAWSGITIIKLLSIDKLHVTAGQVEAFSNLSDVVAHRRKSESRRRWRKREKKGERKERDRRKNTIISVLYQFLEMREKTSNATLTIANGGKRKTYTDMKYLFYFVFK